MSNRPPLKVVGDSSDAEAPDVEALAERTRQLIAQAVTIGGEISEAFVQSLEEAVVKARVTAECPTVPVGVRDVARRALLTLEPVLATLKSLRARA